MKQRTYRYFVGDFETTVYAGQTHTEVWASASVELGTEDVQVFTSIEEQFAYFKSLKCNILCYYHNLKFDGHFWLAHFLMEAGLTQALTVIDGRDDFLDDDDMPNNTFKYLISSMGQWYNITVKVGGYYIVFRDSLKLLPFSVKRIGESFKTKHRKGEIEYKGKRHKHGVITPEEREYIANDILVVKEALEIMQEEGHNGMTIGSCCYKEFRRKYEKREFDELFPDLTAIEIDKEIYGSSNADEYVRKSYHGGWCYVARGCENKIMGRGCTLDVNSLYPSMMSSESGNRYPVGSPRFMRKPPAYFLSPRSDIYFFVRLKTRFKIKKGKLPFIQAKHNLMYAPNEMLETSDVYDESTGKYYDKYINLDGEVVPALLEMTMTCTDYWLMLEHYDLYETEILDCCYFTTEIGLFDEYMEKYKTIKQNSKGARRELAKLFLNNLYGKMATNTISSYKIAFLKPDNSLGFRIVIAFEKKAGYIPIGSAITSYARNFTITTAQANYHEGGRGFKYADTDSIHCDVAPEEIVGVTIHDKNFCCWKMESVWDTAIFVRQKTYIEHIVEEDGEERDYYNIKCAGMPESCKRLLVASFTGKNDGNYNDEERRFIEQPRTLADFKIGLTVPSKLRPKQIEGGVVLVETTYEMR